MLAFSLIHPLRQIPLAFLDVETTGASADFGHRVIEMGIARVENGRIVAQYQQLLDPERRISAGVTALTGISQAMVTGQPRFADELPRMLDLLRGAAIVGHNIRFDLSFLRKEFRRSGQDIGEALGEVPVLDTVRIARRRYGRGGNGLQALAPRLGVFPTVAHRALADVITTYGVFDKLIEPIGGWDLQLADALLAQGGKMGLLPANPRESLLPLELEEALDLKRPVMMEYLDAQEARTCRVVRPLHVRRMGGELTLVAFCELRQAQRTFKVERIVKLSRVGEELPSPRDVPGRAEEVEVPAEAPVEVPPGRTRPHPRALFERWRLREAERSAADEGPTLFEMAGGPAVAGPAVGGPASAGAPGAPVTDPAAAADPGGAPHVERMSAVEVVRIESAAAESVPSVCGEVSLSEGAAEREEVAGAGPPSPEASGAMPSSGEPSTGIARSESEAQAG